MILDMIVELHVEHEENIRIPQTRSGFDEKTLCELIDDLLKGLIFLNSWSEKNLNPSPLPLNATFSAVFHLLQPFSRDRA